MSALLSLVPLFEQPRDNIVPSLIRHRSWTSHIVIRGGLCSRSTHLDSGPRCSCDTVAQTWYWKLDNVSYRLGFNSPEWRFSGSSTVRNLIALAPLVHPDENLQTSHSRRIHHRLWRIEYFYITTERREHVNLRYNTIYQCESYTHLELELAIFHISKSKAWSMLAALQISNVQRWIKIYDNLFDSWPTECQRLKYKIQRRFSSFLFFFFLSIYV